MPHNWDKFQSDFWHHSNQVVSSTMISGKLKNQHAGHRQLGKNVFNFFIWQWVLRECQKLALLFLQPMNSPMPLTCHDWVEFNALLLKQSKHKSELSLKATKTCAERKQLAVLSQKKKIKMNNKMLSHVFYLLSIESSLLSASPCLQNCRQDIESTIVIGTDPKTMNRNTLLYQPSYLAS